MCVCVFSVFNLALIFWYSKVSQVHHAYLLLHSENQLFLQTALAPLIEEKVLEIKI